MSGFYQEHWKDVWGWPNEEWKPVFGFSDYQISTQGRVFHVFKGRFCKLTRNKQGYYRVCLRANTKYVHRLMASAFMNENNRGRVFHLNKDKSDNRLENLAFKN
jgi:hypothetical protein